MKSDRSAEVLHHLGLGYTIGFQAAVSDTSGGKHPESVLYAAALLDARSSVSGRGVVSRD